jgi:hypothetical protein
MKKFLGLLIIIVACSPKAEEEKVYQGKLEELIIGDFVLEKDDETKDMYDLQVMEDDGVELIYYKNADIKNKLIIYKFHEVFSGKLKQQMVIPWEGPDALKGFPTATLPVGKNKLMALSKVGSVGLYDSLATKTSEYKVDFNLSSNSSDMVSLRNGNGLMSFAKGWIQVGQDPSNVMKNFDPKARLMSSEFPLDFTKWLTWIHIETGEVKHSDFLAPNGYEHFKHDLTSTILHGAFDSKRNIYYLSFPYSDSLYHFENQSLIKKIKPTSNIEFNYLPSEVIPWGTNNTVWALPKEASQHLFLLYDSHHDLFVRASKIKESGAGETKFQRTKNYVLSIYSGDWEPKGEYLFDYKGSLNLENWFLTSQGLFLSKPEQPNEDEYEFYRVDLSRFAGK